MLRQAEMISWRPKTEDNYSKVSGTATAKAGKRDLNLNLDTHACQVSAQQRVENNRKEAAGGLSRLSHSEPPASCILVEGRSHFLWPSSTSVTWLQHLIPLLTHTDLQRSAGRTRGLPPIKAQEETFTIMQLQTNEPDGGWEFQLSFDEQVSPLCFVKTNVEVKLSRSTNLPFPLSFSSHSLSFLKDPISY